MVRRTLLLLRGAAAAVAKKTTPLLCWLDLRGSGMSVLERLLLEECILQKDNSSSSASASANAAPSRNWVIVGCHEPVRHRYLRERDMYPTERIKKGGSDDDASWNVDATHSNDSVAIVMGIGGKPSQLLNVDLVREDGVATLKRFSGGGTVVLDFNSIWTTVIGRRDELVDQHFPRPIMEYTADRIFGPMFERLSAMQTAKAKQTSSNTADKSQRLTMVLDIKSCAVENTGRMITLPRNSDQSIAATKDELVAPPAFRLRENDFVWGERKMGGNAQSIGKTGWLHHTSFLWDYHADNMEYLKLPAKRPDYRGDRSHQDFLVKLIEVYPDLSKADFFAALAETCEEEFQVDRVTLHQAMKIVNEQGGMKAWFQSKSRTKVITDL